MKILKSLLFSVKKSIPIGVKWSLRRLLYFGNTQYCNVCSSSIKRFLPGGLNHPVFEKYEIIGGGYHEYDCCPVCRASYRQRLIMLFLDEHKILKPGLRILHAAPEECFHHILNNGKTEYVCGDLEPGRYDYYANPIHLDLLDINFPDNSFDLILCCHILEHIPDDAKAMREIYRVIAPGGIAILQVPVSKKLDKTYEDFSYRTAEERLASFGQRDHVRIYGMDYTERLIKAGFSVETIPSSHFSKARNFDKMMLDSQEVLFIARKA